jgi:hypothetical protein
MGIIFPPEHIAMPHPSAEEVVAKLRNQVPETTFLALGQTVFWDEPVKAVWRRLLDRHWPSAQMIAGIHDTDYFAKSTAHVPDDQLFVALHHDDGATRGLWSAAGELSAFLGSEDVPTRAFFETVGVPFNRLSGRDAMDRRKFFEEYTSAYGWRGIVQTSGLPRIAHDVPLRECGKPLLELLEWGFGLSVASIRDQSKADAPDVSDTIIRWAHDYIDQCQPEGTLTDLYQYLLPKFYELLLDVEPTNFSISATSDLLRFSPATAHLPRFAFLDIFLNPRSRDVASQAYSTAVAGGGMYSLDSFGDGAVPFDVVVPNKGRGTLHVSDNLVTIDFSPEPAEIGTNVSITDVHSLAELLQEQFGSDVVLVGKAVSLISMLSAEFTLIFHETASGYTDRTTVMNNLIRESGIHLPKLSPILRVQYQTWDTLVCAQAHLHLPPHLQRTFGLSANDIEAATFSKRWRGVVEQQKYFISALASAKSFRETATLLQDISSRNTWKELSSEYEHYISSIQKEYAAHAPLRSKVQELKVQISNTKEERKRLEAESGLDYRERLYPLQLVHDIADFGTNAAISEVVQDRERRFSEPLRSLANKQRELQRLLKVATIEKRAAERNEAVQAARSALSAIQLEANLTKLTMARDAFLTVNTLQHTNSRPSAWWFPLVDPTGAWFDALTDSIIVRLEQL